MNAAQKQIIEQRKYGITAAQVAQCANNHPHKLDYACSVTRHALNRLATFTAGGEFTHEQLKQLDAIRVLLNRIPYAAELDQQNRDIQAAQ